MVAIIQFIERLRVERNIKKKQLCNQSNISQNMYTNYIKGAEPSFSKAKQMLESLGKEIVVTDKICKL